MLPDQDAFEEIYRIFNILQIGKEFNDDEARFLDREASITVICADGAVVNTGTGGGHGLQRR